MFLMIKKGTLFQMLSLFVDGNGLQPRHQLVPAREISHAYLLDVFLLFTFSVQAFFRWTFSSFYFC